MFYSVKTFGCKVNTYDSSLIQKRMEEKGWQEAPLQEDSMGSQTHIVNTCAVTEEAVKEAKRWIRRYRKKNPHARILVTGCAAQTETDQFANLKEVDLVVANSHKAHLAKLVADTNKEQKVFKSSIFKNDHLLEAGGRLENHHSRLFLKIQDGCDSFCTFCIIPFARGKSRSIAPEVLIDSVNKHHAQGVQEVVLTGVHIGDYQVPDKKDQGLAKLLELLLMKTNIPRIRLSSLEPVELTESLLALYSSPRVCPHFHVSLQSSSTSVLKRMKRKYNAQDVEKSLININKKVPSAFVGMDVIAGFGEETQKEFEDNYMRLKILPWTKMHVFPYSPRRYTFANRHYKTLARSVIVKRAALLRHLSESRYKTELEKQVGQLKKVLPLKDNAGFGLSRDYWVVDCSGIKKSNHQEVTVKIGSVNADRNCLVSAG